MSAAAGSPAAVPVAGHEARHWHITVSLQGEAMDQAYAVMLLL